MISRGILLKLMAMTVPIWTAIAIPAAVSGQMLLDPMTQQKFVNPLPIAARLDATAGGTYHVTMSEFTQHLGIFDPVTGAPLMTTVWGYNGTYPGPTFVTHRDVPVDVQWYNNLVGVTLNLPVDQTLHWADPLMEHPGSGQYTGPIPVVPHLHGGHTESESDGLPEAWWTPGFEYTGAHFVKDLYHYDNDQEAGTLWYHDHALGITRLNVYAGLAAFYLLRDDNELALIEGGFLPRGPYEIEMAIQDRMFYADGQLYYPSMPGMPGQPDPSALPEFFGDFILVNAAAWPVLEVEPRQYRFRMLNGSDSRFYNMFLTSGNLVTPSPMFHQIGTDVGFLPAPVMLEQMLLAPGERADVVIDFSDPVYWGQTLILRNNARSPYPKGMTVDPNTSGQIMAFRVTKPLDQAYPLTTLPASLRADAILPLVQTGATRQLLLFEGIDQYGRLQPLLGTIANGALLWDDPITENPMLDDVEVWEVYNATMDAHPIHLHLVAFQILGRQKFKANVNPANGALTNVKLVGMQKPPDPRESGWKDTAVMYPGEVTRVIAHFDREGRYVWHCHILSHEDHEMMRPYHVGTQPIALASSPARISADNPAATPAGYLLDQNYPNPFNPATQISFTLPVAQHVTLNIYNVGGQKVRTLADGAFSEGEHTLTWDGSDDLGAGVASGVYFYQLSAGAFSQMRKMVLLR